MIQLQLHRQAAPAGEPLATFAPMQTLIFADDRFRARLEGKHCTASPLGGWDFEGKRGGGFSILGVAVVHFESGTGERSRVCGPYGDIHGIEQLVRVASGRLFASYSAATARWRAFALDSDWPVMVVTATPAESRVSLERRGLVAPVDASVRSSARYQR